jgi:hypothetical protein
MDMQSDMWAWLFRRVPAEQYNQLVIMTNTGTEIAVQTLLRIEPDFIAIKGRLAATQDAGRVYFIPFINIDYFGFQRDVKETEFDDMFGAGPLSLSVPAAIANAARVVPVVQPAAPAPVVPAAPPASLPAVEIPNSASVSQKTPLPLKSEVLERFRSRIAGQPLTSVPSRSGNE